MCVNTFVTIEHGRRSCPSQHDAQETLEMLIEIWCAETSRQRSRTSSARFRMAQKTHLFDRGRSFAGPCEQFCHCIANAHYFVKTM